MDGTLLARRQRLGRVRLSPGRIRGASRTRSVKRLSYRFFRRLFFVVGSTEKVDDVRSGGSIGAALTVVLTFTLPDGVSDVFVRMRMVPPSICIFCTVSLPESGVFQSCYPHYCANQISTPARTGPARH